jgi:hypothetical protein
LSKGCPKVLTGNSHVCGNMVYVQGNTYAFSSPPRPHPPERVNVHTYTADLGRQRSYVHRTRVQKTRAICRGRFQYNNVLCSLQGTQWQEAQCSSLSLWHTYKLRGYYQYWAIPIYIRFYSIYVKSAEQTLYS